MSFSSEVKEELSRHLPTARHCQIAETAAILSLCGQISEKDGTIRIQTENAYVARKYFTLLKKTFNIEAELAVKLNQKENTYLIRVNDREETRQILQAVKLHETDRQLAMPIPAVVVQRQCCKRAFLRVHQRSQPVLPSRNCLPRCTESRTGAGTSEKLWN